MFPVRACRLQSHTRFRTSLLEFHRGLVALAVAVALLAATAASVAAAPDAPPRHLVQAGETLDTLAQQYGSTVPALLAANGLDAAAPLQPGQVLVAPAAAQPLLTVQAQPLDTPASLARRYQTSIATVRTLNALAAGARLTPGQDVLVPAPANGPSPALPAGPLRGITTRPAVARQGETVYVQLDLDTTQPVSVSLRLPPQQTRLHPLDDDSLWGLAVVHAFTEPGISWLEISWQATGEPISQTLRWPLPVIDGGYPTYDIVLPDDKGDLLAPELVQAELARMVGLWSAVSPLPNGLRTFIRPIANDYPTSAPFGQRRSYNSGPVDSFHAGQDFAAPAGVDVVAPAAGVVVLAETMLVRGNAVLIDHGGGVFTGYWHLTDMAVQPGQPVQPGDLLGHVGTTGLSTGNHLHWELRVNGFAADPLQWLQTHWP